MANEVELQEQEEFVTEAIDITSMLEMVAYRPRLRVKLVQNDGEDEVNDAAIALEDNGHTVTAFQFESWTDGDGEIGSCCWITYALADEDQDNQE